MFQARIEYPCAISDHTDEGYDVALRWVLDHLDGDDFLTVWVSQKSVLTSNDFVRGLSSRRDVRVAVGRGGGYFAAGPVLALYADADDLGKIAYARGITALCVVPWSDQLKTWTREARAVVLHELDLDDDDRDFLGATEPVGLAPDVVGALESMTGAINHNNTISAGYEKEVVVRALIRLHDRGFSLPAQEMKEWAAAHGWSGENPTRLGEFVERINRGVRPRFR